MITPFTGWMVQLDLESQQFHEQLQACAKDLVDLAQASFSGEGLDGKASSLTLFRRSLTIWHSLSQKWDLTSKKFCWGILWSSTSCTNTSFKIWLSIQFCWWHSLSYPWSSLLMVSTSVIISKWWPIWSVSLHKHFETTNFPSDFSSLAELKNTSWIGSHHCWQLPLCTVWICMASIQILTFTHSFNLNSPTYMNRNVGSCEM